MVMHRVQAPGRCDALGVFMIISPPSSSPPPRVQVDIRELVALRDAIIVSGKDMHRPINLIKRFKSINKDEEVNRSLMTLLSIKGEDYEVR